MDPRRRERKLGAVEAALREHGPRLKAFVNGRVRPAEVDDVLQTAAMRAVEGAASLKDPDRVLPWLYRIHRNAVTDAIRCREARRRWVDGELSAGDVPSQEAETQNAEMMCGCSVSQVQRINPRYASVLKLVDLGSASLAEAARTLGISVNNATVRLHRARRALRETMREHCGVTSLRECGSCRCIDDGCCSA